MALLCLALTLSISTEAEAEVCESSWYGPGFLYNTTASGEVFVGQADYTVASPYLPFGTVIYAENLYTGAWGLFRVNDRGPFIGDRCLDFSQPYIVSYGVAPVYFEVVYWP